MLHTSCTLSNASALCVCLAGAFCLTGASSNTFDIPSNGVALDDVQASVECMLQDATTLLHRNSELPLTSMAGSTTSTVPNHNRDQLVFAAAASTIHQATQTLLQNSLSIAEATLSELKNRAVDSGLNPAALASVLLIMGILWTVLSVLTSEPELQDKQPAIAPSQMHPGRTDASQHTLPCRTASKAPSTPPVAVGGYDYSRAASSALVPQVPGTWRKSFIPDTAPALYLPNGQRNSSHLAAPGFGKPSMSQLSLPPASARDDDKAAYYLCLELVVPESRECTLLIPRPWIAVHNPLRVADARGVAVFTASFVSGQGRFPQDRVLILASADDGAQFGVLGEVTHALTIGPCVTVYNSTGGIFGLLKPAVHFQSAYVLAIGGRDCVFVSGDSIEGATSIKDDEGRLLAIAEPRPNITTGNDLRSVTVGPLVDAGLILLCFLGVDMLEFAKHRRDSIR